MTKPKYNRSTNQYFIAILIKGEVGNAIMNLKKHMAEKYSSRAALRSPPHITLHMPFKKSLKNEKSIIDMLQAIANEQGRFEIDLNNFNCFEPRVIYIDVKDSDQLNVLQTKTENYAKTQLNIYNSNFRNHAFKPHITIAFRDLRKAEFYRAWSEIRGQNFNFRYLVQSISLLKHDTKQWQELFEAQFAVT